MRTIVCLILLQAMLVAGTDTASAVDLYAAPNVELQHYLEALPKQEKDPTAAIQLDVQTLSVPSNRPSTSQPSATASVPNTKTVPFSSTSSVLLKFKAGVNPAEAADYIKANNLHVIEKFPSMGAIQVESDLSRFIKPDASGSVSNLSVLNGLLEATAEYKKDPRIDLAAPDLALTKQEVDNGTLEVVSSSARKTSDDLAAKFEDWGINDIQANKIWDLPGARDGTVFGVMDVGFGKHEDLIFIDLPNNIPRDDHGNHVSGIACGSHTFAKGVKGVIPNCFIRAYAGDIRFTNTEAPPVYKFSVFYSQIMSTLDSFIRDQNDVAAFNVSLGYNWMANFLTDPGAPEAASYRALIESVGQFLGPALKILQDRDRVVFAAAGNDSFGRTPPIPAKYSSPLHWMIITAREQGVKSGIIVEAHDQKGHRAPFSNSGGSISCPGSSIMSAVAFAPSGAPSDHHYGTMDGTSMASPYCAAGFVLFRLVRPKLSAQEALNCLMSSSAKTDEGIPMLRLADAVQACP